MVIAIRGETVNLSALRGYQVRRFQSKNKRAAIMPQVGTRWREWLNPAHIGICAGRRSHTTFTILAVEFQPRSVLRLNVLVLQAYSPVKSRPQRP
jgi:hypothetical protein